MRMRWYLLAGMFEYVKYWSRYIYCYTYIGRFAVICPQYLLQAASHHTLLLKLNSSLVKSDKVGHFKTCTQISADEKESRISSIFPNQTRKELSWLNRTYFLLISYQDQTHTWKISSFSSAPHTNLFRHIHSSMGRV